MNLPFVFERSDTIAELHPDVHIADGKRGNGTNALEKCTYTVHKDACGNVAPVGGDGAYAAVPDFGRLGVGRTMSAQVYGESVSNGSRYTLHDIHHYARCDMNNRNKVEEYTMRVENDLPGGDVGAVDEDW